MRKNFIITGTNNIEGCPIIKYLGPICTNVVIGTNIFSDIAASFSDFFGGMSNTYKNKLENIYEKATAALKDKAVNLGANAIIGFSVDFDEISGGGKSMFMISASGTACVIKEGQTDKDDKQQKVGILSQAVLDYELNRQFIINEINGEDDLLSNIDNEWMEFLYEHPQKEIVPKLVDKYIKYKESGISSHEVLSFIARYFCLLQKSDVADVLYSKINEFPIVKVLIKDCGLFSASHILELAKRNPQAAIFLLDAKTDCYQKQDLNLMKELLLIYDNLPDTGKIEMVKGGFLSKDEEKFVCANGHKSDKESEFCDICGINIKGLNFKEIQKIEDFRLKVAILEELL